jgi:hypothetical protein
MINLFYIGDDYYFNSGSIISCIYEVGTYKRYDWGLVNNALINMESINIRPADDKEIEWAKLKLKQVEERRKGWNQSL